MAKRFTDTEKWKKPFIKGLSSLHKLVWLYVIDECDHAGVWEVEHEVLEARLKESIDLDEFLKACGEKIHVFENGRKWFIQDFVDFQYGELQRSNRLHVSVIHRIEKYKLNNIKPLISPLEGVKGIYKDKDKDKDKGGVGGKSKSELEREFENIWQKYPNRDGKKHAKRHFLATVKTAEDIVRIRTALDNYLKSKKVKDGFVKNGSTWFNQWEDFVNFSEPKQVTPEEKKTNSRREKLKKELEEIDYDAGPAECDAGAVSKMLGDFR